MEEKDAFQVTVESLYTKKIKEISYDEEEAYQEKPTLSQKLTELAQRVDFSSKAGDDTSEPAAKKSTQRWPWELANSKLKQALTEASVLVDVIQIAQHHKMYAALDPVMASPTGGASPAYQYLVKKKSLALATEILQKGMKALSLSSSDKEREFHRALSSLRHRWRLKRTGTGTIIGDLSYHSAGSVYSGPISFDVTKTKVKDPKSADSALAAADVISVNIPREYRGRSEILVFLSPQPVQEIPPLSRYPPPLSMTTAELFKERRATLSAEMKLITAQNVIFNQELFSQLAREAYDQKPEFQHEVTTNRINIPLSLDSWLSVVYVREYDEDPSPSSSSSHSSSLSPRWDLVVALKQLLRDTHRRRTSLVKPRPSTSGFQDQPELRNAGIVPLKTQDLKKLNQQQSDDFLLFSKFMDKAKHVYNEERLQQWLEELCGTTADPSLGVVWEPDPSLTCTTARLTISDSLATSKGAVRVVLKVDKVTVRREEVCGGDLTFPIQKDKLFTVLKQQVLFHRMKHASKFVAEQDWVVVQELPHPLLTATSAPSSRPVEMPPRQQPMLPQQQNFLESTSLLLESSDSQSIMELLFNWNSLTATKSTLKLKTTRGAGGDMGSTDNKWISETSTIGPSTGTDFRSQFIALFDSVQ